MSNVKQGEQFFAIVRKGVYSKTLAGEEGAGKRIGPFVASGDSTSVGVRAGSRFFRSDHFSIERKGE